MQTFLPFPDFKKSIQCLDNKRLGKQRVEALQILNILRGRTESNAWSNHPAVLMWRDYEHALNHYLLESIYEWIKRGFKNSIRGENPLVINYEKPFWLGNEEFHASHKSNLLRKDLSWYGKFGWKEPDNLSYIWPVKMFKGRIK